MAKRSQRAKKKSKATSAPTQNNLSDSNGEITAHERYKDVDKELRKMFEARDQVANLEEERTDALARVETLLIEHGHEGVYIYDHAGSKFKCEIKKKEKISIQKMKKKELELAAAE